MVGKEIKRFRIEAGLTQKELAQKAGVTQQCISKYERDTTGEANYEYKICMKILAALDVEVFFRKRRTGGGELHGDNQSTKSTG